MRQGGAHCCVGIPAAGCGRGDRARDRQAASGRDGGHARHEQARGVEVEHLARAHVSCGLRRVAARAAQAPGPPEVAGQHDQAPGILGGLHKQIADDVGRAALGALEVALRAVGACLSLAQLGHHARTARGPFHLGRRLGLAHRRSRSPSQSTMTSAMRSPACPSHRGGRLVTSTPPDRASSSRGRSVAGVARRLEP